MKPNLLGWTALAAFAALLAVALPAAAEWYEGKPDCPPDMACTLSGGGAAPPPDGGGSDGGAGSGPGNASAEPIAYGPGDCIACSGPVGRGPEDCEYCRGDGATGNATDGPSHGDCGGEVCAYDAPGQGSCLDGSAPAEACDADKQYLDGGAGGADAPGKGRQEAASLGAQAVPALGALGLAMVGLGAAVLLVTRGKP